jgi:hypothetical protein
VTLNGLVDRLHRLAVDGGRLELFHFEAWEVAQVTTTKPIAFFPT